MTSTKETAAPKAIIVDGDGTAWTGRVATGIGKAYLTRELLGFHLNNVRAGIKGARRVNEVVAAGGANGNALGLMEFYKVLHELGLGRQDEMRAYALKYVRKHAIDATHALLRRFPASIPRILATTGGSTAADAAAEHFGFQHVLANEDLFDSARRLTGVKLNIMNGAEKLTAVTMVLENLGASIGECMAIGDGIDDVQTLKAAGVRYAPPWAHEMVLAIPGIITLRTDQYGGDVPFPREVRRPTLGPN